jgi:hypothetical protein
MYEIRLIDPVRDVQWDQEFAAVPRVGEDVLISDGSAELIVAHVTRVIHESTAYQKTIRVYIEGRASWDR